MLAYIKGEAEDGSASLVNHEKIESIIDLADGDKNFLNELLSLFTTRSPELIEQMRKAAQENSMDKLEHAAHALKGTSGNLGATRMMKLCEQIEQFAKEQSYNLECAKLIEEVALSYPETQKIIHKRLTS